MPQIHQEDKQLQIQLDKKVIVSAEGEILYKNRINLANIIIDQKVFLMKSGHVLVYEDATVASSYELNHGINKTVGILFPHYQYKLIDTQANIHFFKLENKSDTLYLILENMNKKRVKMVYGFDTKSFNSIFTLLTGKEFTQTETKEIINQTSLNKNPALYIKSEWSHKNIILDTIIRRVGLSKAAR
jgi:hypothetical protein